ncbi:hypothetical protein DEI81_12240 [Curtobacterium sp. MCBD17_013]|uniref:hypothetical protein n=1 Tax=unclassified Curtobacterium TaxID=257496 RepID=UPI000DA96DFC|nr:MULTISPECIES: hypothetical protein [unclassified Curtobacterium]PZF60757.1 hypothetical protein DEI81_12240 [Curtobacterium sp. MCBD17_013]WIB62952.1 hypothetical protein DEI94_12420 [Curtobacterium sp. MCBD17_040]
MTTHLGPDRRIARGVDRWAIVRWGVVVVWVALLVVRVTVVTTDPAADLRVLGVVQFLATLVGVLIVALGVGMSWSKRVRTTDVSLGRAIRSIDPTVRLVPAVPTSELRDLVGRAHPEVALGRHVVWGFGATEASLWQLDGRQALRVLVVRWTRVVHVGVEDLPDGSSSPHRAVIAIHFHRPDGTPAVATFAVRRALGSLRLLGRGPALDRLSADLAAERVVL